MLVFQFFSHVKLIISCDCQYNYCVPRLQTEMFEENIFFTFLENTKIFTDA
jgi:hypothetical protein